MQKQLKKDIRLNPTKRKALQILSVILMFLNPTCGVMLTGICVSGHWIWFLPGVALSSIIVTLNLKFNHWVETKPPIDVANRVGILEDSDLKL